MDNEIRTMDKSQINVISCGSSWVDGRIIFKPNKKHAQFFYGICHYSDHCYAVSPLDWSDATMIKSINVSPSTGYCEKAQVCLHFDCRARLPWIFKLNNFNKFSYANEFKDSGIFSLGLPKDIGTKTLWFNEGNWGAFWYKVIKNYKPEGVVLTFNDYKDHDFLE